MFLLPVSTDAPIYHFPWGTIGLIAVTSLVLFASTVGLLPPVETLAPGYGLVHGEGLHPLQWFTSNFLHANWGHLIGNMMFLWPFGLIVEGKLGWRRFLMVYFGIGIVESALEQICLPGPGVSLGASSIIFGLMAIACLWAPKNDIEMMWGIWAPFFVKIDTFDFPVLWLSLLMVAKEAAVAAWLRFSIGSELFHLVGAALGFGIGASLLKANLVDCERWDLWSVLKRSSSDAAVLRHTEARVIDGRSSEMAALSKETEQSKKTGRKIRALTRIHQCLTTNDAAGAWAELLRTRQVIDHFELGHRDLVRLAQALIDSEHWSESVAAYEELIERFPADAEVSRLIVAEILVDRHRRPTAALRHLDAIDPDRLTGKQPALYQRLKTTAEQLADSGVIELEGKSWESA